MQGYIRSQLPSLQKEEASIKRFKYLILSPGPHASDALIILYVTSPVGRCALVIDGLPWRLFVISSKLYSPA